MGQCYYCRGTLSLAVLEKNRYCPSCGSDIHCCANCIHYDESLATKCREPDTPWLADRTAQNNCPIFEQKSGPSKATQDKEGISEAERAKKAAQALFRNP